MDRLCTDIILDILFKDWKFVHPLSFTSKYFHDMIEINRLTIAKYYTKNGKLPNGKIHGHRHIHIDVNDEYGKVKDIYENYDYGKRTEFQIVDNKTDLITQYTYWINNIVSKGLSVHYNYKFGVITVYQHGRYKEKIVYKPHDIPTTTEFMNTQFMTIYNNY
jgi:hypothetical protein